MHISFQSRDPPYYVGLTGTDRAPTRWIPVNLSSSIAEARGDLTKRQFWTES
jgi:hypothetical protein